MLILSRSLICMALMTWLLQAAAIPLQDPLQNPGFVHFFNNEYEQAIDYFEKQIAADPKNPEQYNHLSQAILYRELFRNGSLESQLVSGNNAFLRRDKMKISLEDKRRFMGCLDRAFALSEAQLSANPQDARALYEEAVTHGLRANYYFLVEKAWTDSLRAASASRKADDKVLEIDPAFIDAHLILGVYSYVVGSLPFYMRALGAVGGFHGDREGGIQQLQLVASKGVLNKYDAQVLLAVLYRREHRARQAIPLLKNLAQQFPRNALFRFEQVQMYSDLGDEKSALEILATIDQLQRSGAPGYAQVPPDKIRFVAGNLYFWYNNLPSALENLQQVTRDASQLDLNTALIGWLRLGQTYDLQGRHTEAIGAYRESIKVAPGSEVASEAKGYISNPYHRRASSQNSE